MKKPKKSLQDSKIPEKKEEIVFEGPLAKQRELIKGPLSWINVNVQLKKNSLSWTAKDVD